MPVRWVRIDKDIPFRGRMEPTSNKYHYQIAETGDLTNAQQESLIRYLIEAERPFYGSQVKFTGGAMGRVVADSGHRSGFRDGGTAFKLQLEPTLAGSLSSGGTVVSGFLTYTVCWRMGPKARLVKYHHIHRAEAAADAQGDPTQILAAGQTRIATYATNVRVCAVNGPPAFEARLCNIKGEEPGASYLKAYLGFRELIARGKRKIYPNPY